MKKMIIFDWDDVITLGSKEGYYKCYRETLKSLNISLPENEFHKRIQEKWGQPYREELKVLLSENPTLLNKAVEIFEKHFWGYTFVDCLKEVPGANQILINLSKKYTLTVATGNHPKMLTEMIIPKFNVPPVFKQIITSFDVPTGKTKPNPYMLEQLMQTQKVKPVDCFYVGDAENDVLMARNAKVEPIVVLTGHLTKLQALKLKVDQIIPDITHLPNTLNY